MQSELPALYRGGAEAAEFLLADVYRLDVHKALDPLNRHDFLVIVGRISSVLYGVAREHEARALKRALESLDVDWPNLNEAARAQVVAATKRAIGSAGEQVLPKVEHVFEVEAGKVVAGTKASAVRRFDLRIDADLSRTDRRIADFARRSQGHFVRDEYGRRQEAAGQAAREIVASGLERGLGRDDITEELAAKVGAIVTGRSKSYWQVVAMSFANRARTHTQLAAFQDAEITRYRFEAVMDEVTCLPAGTRVSTAHGWVPIETVRPGDLVRSHLGRFVPVAAARATRRRRRMCVVRVRGGEPLLSTANHPFLVRREGRLGWVHAGELRAADRVVMLRSG